MQRNFGYSPSTYCAIANRCTTPHKTSEKIDIVKRFRCWRKYWPIDKRNDEYDDIRSCSFKVLAEFNNLFIENNEILSALSNSPNMEHDELKPLANIGATGAWIENGYWEQ